MYRVKFINVAVPAHCGQYYGADANACISPMGDRAFWGPNPGSFVRSFYDLGINLRWLSLPRSTWSPDEVMSSADAQKPGKSLRVCARAHTHTRMYYSSYCIKNIIDYRFTMVMSYCVKINRRQRSTVFHMNPFFLFDSTSIEFRPISLLSAFHRFVKHAWPNLIHFSSFL
jgi:hypothetical protein